MTVIAMCLFGVPVSIPPLRLHVKAIIEGSPEKKMGWIHTRRIVTRMANEEVAGVSQGQNPGGAVGGDYDLFRS